MYADVFLPDLAMELLKYTSMNDHAIELEENKELLYDPIYNVSQVELEIQKTYIETCQTTGFIWTPKSLVDVLIFFD